MFIHPQFDPVAISIGSLSIHWYGLMYLLGFVAFIMLARKRLCWFPAIRLEDVDNLLTFAVMGVILGGRLGYVLFYKPAYYMTNPMEIMAIWEGGMSFHGGFLGVLLTCYAYARHKKWHFLDLTDFVAPAVPIGLALGRLGNFINGELWGRPTDSFLGVIFPQAGDLLARHPSQLYQMFLEGLLLFVVLWVFASKPRSRGAVSSLFLLGYGLARFVAEFAREPDRFLGTLSFGLTMGQWLCMPMMMAGFLLWRYSQRQTPAWFSMNGGIKSQNDIPPTQFDGSQQLSQGLFNEPHGFFGVKQSPFHHLELMQKALNAIASIFVLSSKQKLQKSKDELTPKEIHAVQHSSEIQITQASLDELQVDGTNSLERNASHINTQAVESIVLKAVQADEAHPLKTVVEHNSHIQGVVKTNKRTLLAMAQSALDPNESLTGKQAPVRRKLKEAGLEKPQLKKTSKKNEKSMVGKNNDVQTNQTQSDLQQVNNNLIHASKEKLAAQSQSSVLSNEVPKSKSRKSQKLHNSAAKPEDAKDNSVGSSSEV